MKPFNLMNISTESIHFVSLKAKIPQGEFLWGDLESKLEPL